MVTARSLDELKLGDLWAEVPPSEDEFWRDSQEKQQVLLKALLEGALEEEMTQLLGERPSAQTVSRIARQLDDRRGPSIRRPARETGDVVIMR